jgi:hypothetical protein
MIATQYKITLPSDCDMSIIRERVRDNGYKTDGFEDLKFKLYLITEKGVHHNLQNSYSPLYLWNGSDGLNKFLFGGFYDNILNSFGWQHVNVGIPLIDTTSTEIVNCKYVLHITGEIQPRGSLIQFRDQVAKSLPEVEGGAETLVIYNPNKWEYDAFYFVCDVGSVEGLSGVIYTILHVSQGES